MVFPHPSLPATTYSLHLLYFITTLLITTPVMSLFPSSSLPLLYINCKKTLVQLKPKPSQEKLLLCKAGTGLKVHVWCICWLHQGADDAPCRILLSQLVGGSLPPLMPCVGLEVVWRNMAAAPVPPQTLTPFHLLLSSTSTILTSEWP